MHRRTLLKLLSAMALVGCEREQESPPGLRVVIAGAGIVGASIAYHLAKRGASVTVIDAVAPASHATGGTFAWINATWAKQPRHYHSLTQESVANWRDLDQELNLGIRWNGSIEWYEDTDRMARLEEQIAEQQAWGEDARMIAIADIAESEPNVNFGAAEQVAFSGFDGAVDPITATRALLAAAANLGAKIHYPSELTDIVMRGGRLHAVVTAEGEVRADRLILATGASADAPKRFAACPIPQRSTPGVIVTTRPAPMLLNSIIAAPGAHLHQRSDRRIVLGEQAGAPQNEAHALRLTGRPNEFPAPQIAAEHAERMYAIARQFVPDIDAVEVEQVRIGWRPLPLDGHPVLGASPERPDVYLAIMHSGVSLAPIVGQLVAHEITTDTAIERLDAYRPGRGFEIIKRY